MKIKDIQELFDSHKLDQVLKELICNNEIKTEKKRYQNVLKIMLEEFKDGDVHLFSAPGRCEIGGNHTDHQHGRVIAAALNADMIAAAKKTDVSIIRIHSIGFDIQPVNLQDCSIQPHEIHTTEALIRGIGARFQQLGYQVGGFEAVIDSKIPIGSGISSSASFEVLCAEIFNHLYNDGKIDPVNIAKIAQYAENIYFMKPCGLLDQMAISLGGFTFMDFYDKEKPVVEKLDFNFKDYGYTLLLTNTHEDHSDLSNEYASITEEMKMVANEMNQEVLGFTSKEEFINHIGQIKDHLKNDRSLIRALHFYQENERVLQQKNAIQRKDLLKLLVLMNQSGASSIQQLQNIYCTNQPDKQALSLGLAISADYLKEDGACRVHGGGFGGTLQAIVPEKLQKGYIERMQTVFGKRSVMVMHIRQKGGCKII